MSQLPSNDARASAHTAAAEIQAEIEDHLSTAAERLQSQGLAESDARQKSHEKFGDAAAISRRCYWIKQGDAVMFRAAVIGLLSILCLALAATVFTSWQSQRQTAEQMAALAEQLRLLAEQQRTAIVPQSDEAKPLEITGQVYVRSVDKPSPNTEIMICRVSDGEIVRRTATNSEGFFGSGPLSAGDYTVLANGVKHPSWKGAIGRQMAPIYLYPSKPSPNVIIDVAYRYGQIGVKLSRPLPKLRVDGKYVIDSRLIFSAQPSNSTIRSVRWTVADPVPAQWPLYIDNPETAPKDVHGFNLSRSVVLSNEDAGANQVVQFRDGSDLVAGTWEFSALVRADVVPDGPLDLEKMIFNNRSTRHPHEDRQWMSNYWVTNETMGQVWTLMLGKRQHPNFPYTSLRSLNRTSGVEAVDWPRYWPSVPVDDGRLMTLIIEIPDDITSQIQALVESVTDPEEFIEKVSEQNPFIRPAKITVLGSEPLADSK
jgi:type II secretory pathway pseudopilin PulG